MHGHSQSVENEVPRAVGRDSPSLQKDLSIMGKMGDQELWLGFPATRRGRFLCRFRVVWIGRGLAWNFGLGDRCEIKKQRVDGHSLAQIQEPLTAEQFGWDRIIHASD